MGRHRQHTTDATLDIVKQREPVKDKRLGRLEVGEEGAEGVRHAGSQDGDADQVGAVEQAESKPVGWQFVEVVVVPEEFGGLGLPIGATS